MQVNIDEEQEITEDKLNEVQSGEEEDDKNDEQDAEIETKVGSHFLEISFYKVALQ